MSHDEITWIGEQRLMQGYCGRAVREQSQASVGSDAGLLTRVLIARKSVVRIGPRKAGPKREDISEMQSVELL